jgi:hypothetical protein
VPAFRRHRRSRAPGSLSQADQARSDFDLTSPLLGRQIPNENLGRGGSLYHRHHCLDRVPFRRTRNCKSDSLISWSYNRWGDDHEWNCFDLSVQLSKTSSVFRQKTMSGCHPFLRTPARPSCVLAFHGPALSSDAATLPGEREPYDHLQSSSGAFSRLSLGQSSARTPRRDLSPPGIAIRPMLGGAGGGAC